MRAYVKLPKPSEDTTADGRVRSLPVGPLTAKSIFITCARKGIDSVAQARDGSYRNVIKKNHGCFC
jgi:hypothetical protein